MDYIFVHPPGKLELGIRSYNCALGWGGVNDYKEEGDGVTPYGEFPMREVYYRSDRVEKPFTDLPVKELTPEDAWCDDPDCSSYNSFVKLPHEGSYENLWRDDGVYDVIVPLGYNDDPVVPGKGSAIFMHVTQPKPYHTDGSVALKLEDLLKVLRDAGSHAKVYVEYL